LDNNLERLDIVFNAEAFKYAYDAAGNRILAEELPDKLYTSISGLFSSPHRADKWTGLTRFPGFFPVLILFIL